MHCHCGTNNRAPRWTFTDPCKPEVRPGAREESASPALLAAPAMNARETTKVYSIKKFANCWSIIGRPSPHASLMTKPHVNRRIGKRNIELDCFDKKSSADQNLIQLKSVETLTDDRLAFVGFSLF